MSLDSDGCLVVSAPAVCGQELHTHDLAVVEDTDSGQRFRITGRIDNVICSGGVKIQIEEVEAALRPALGDNIQVTSVPHPKFGQAVVLRTTLTDSKESLSSLLRQLLPNPYWMPRHILYVPELPRTETGKPDRAKARAMAGESLEFIVHSS